MSKSPFDIAHSEKIKLTKTTAKKVTKIYKDVYMDLKKELKNLKIVNPSDRLKKIYLENFVREAKKVYNETFYWANKVCVQGGEKAGKIAVEAGNKFLTEAGLSIKGAFSYISEQEVKNIISGKLYGGNWSLSKSIWKSTNKIKSDVEKVVAKGLAENRSTKEIADALEKYVNPSAKKPWDWGKVYPGTAKQVDYNTQRLARTMIQHSYQSSLVQSMKYNPWCEGVIWWSVGLHGRTCEECLDRDGRVFPLAELPLDHPNGLCYFEPAMPSMDKIADDIADWAIGGENTAIDTYVEKALDPKDKIPKSRLRQVKKTSRTLLRGNKRL